MRNIIIAVIAGAALAGCASSSADIQAAYVSPVQYQNYTCQQLAMEAQAISQRAAIVSGAQDQKRTNDGIATAAAVVIFWPAAFFVSGDGPTAAELANLKGQLVAVEQASRARNCGIQFHGAPQPGGAPPPAAGASAYECPDGSVVSAPDACRTPAPPPRRSVKGATKS